MHEFSLAGEVIRLVEFEAEKNKAVSVSEITIEVGNMSGVDADAFETAIQLLSEKSILDKTEIKIIRICGKGVCPSCGNEFEMKNRVDTCPECQMFPNEIKGGHEFRVVSLVIDEE